MSKHHHLRPDADGTPREHWSVDAGDADVAVLDIPADARRDRVFEIDCRFEVRLPADRADGDGWHELRVTIDGAVAWTRRSPTHNPGASDSLEWHQRRVLPSGEPLRVAAATRVSGVGRRALVITADETDPA